MEEYIEAEISHLKQKLERVQNAIRELNLDHDKIELEPLLASRSFLNGSITALTCAYARRSQ